MPAKFPAGNPSYLIETSSGDHESWWEGPITDVWRSGVNQWQGYILNSRGENRQLVLTKVEQIRDNDPPCIDYAEIGRESLTSVVQQYFMGLKGGQWSEDKEFYYLVGAIGREITGQRIYNANFQLPKITIVPKDPLTICPHPEWH